MRTFIAIKILPEAALLQCMSELKKELRGEPIKWVDEQKLHLTLKFLGDTSEEQVIQVKPILKEIAQVHQPFSFLPAGLGYFKSHGMPRVLFVDIQEADSLKQLAAAVDELISPAGFEIESRSFNPHLTLARIKFLKNKKGFYDVVNRYRHLSLHPVTINEIMFYQSLLKPEGPVYKELANYQLTGNR